MLKVSMAQGSAQTSNASLCLTLSPGEGQKHREPGRLERTCFSGRKISARAFEYEQLLFGQRRKVQRAPEIGYRTGPVALGCFAG